MYRKDWAPDFLEGVCDGLSVRDACIRVGIDTSMPSKRRATDAAFALAWMDAAGIGTEALEQEAARRAYHGTLKPVFYKGTRCGSVRTYSDVLMIFLLKARKPEVYRDADQRVDVNVTSNTNNLTLNVFDDIDAATRSILDRGDRPSAGPSPGDVPSDGVTEPVDATQPDHPAPEPEAD